MIESNGVFGSKSVDKYINVSRGIRSMLCASSRSQKPAYFEFFRINFFYIFGCK